MAQLEANGVTIDYDIRGSGEPILFVMGLGGQLVDWPEEFVDLFVDRGYQAIRFDNRDIGLSSRTSHEPPTQRQLTRSFVTRRALDWDGYTLVDMAGDAAGLLDQLGIPSAHVVGMSMGGMIAQELAIGHATKVRSLCSIMSNTGDRRNGRISARLTAKLARRPAPSRATAVDESVNLFKLISGPHFNPAQFRILAKAAYQRSFDPVGVARQTAAIAASRDRTPLLAGVKAPTLVIHGLVDPLVQPDGGTTTANAIPGSRLLAFGDMGHDLPRPRWQEMADAIIVNCQRSTLSPEMQRQA